MEKRTNLNLIKSRNYVCPNCSQGYKNKRTLDTHLRTVCGQEPKFQCPYCGLKSKHPPNIYTHIRRRHKGEDLFLIIDQDQEVQTSKIIREQISNSWIILTLKSKLINQISRKVKNNNFLNLVVNSFLINDFLLRRFDSLFKSESVKFHWLFQWKVTDWKNIFHC